MWNMLSKHKCIPLHRRLKRSKYYNNANLPIIHAYYKLFVLYELLKLTDSWAHSYVMYFQIKIILFGKVFHIKDVKGYGDSKKLIH